ncbi:MAG TPA: hypothetical protein VGM82_18395 [Gemmatimonadaceae bacterium]|jgi:hypothetical protein
MPAKSDPRDDAVDTYDYRRSLSARELLPAIGAGIAAGALVFYVARILMQRTPVTVEGLSRSTARKRPAGALPGPRAD